MSTPKKEIMIITNQNGQTFYILSEENQDLEYYGMRKNERGAYGTFRPSLEVIEIEMVERMDFNDPYGNCFWAFELSGAHAGDELAVFVRNPRMEYDDDGRHVEWEAVCYAAISGEKEIAENIDEDLLALYNSELTDLVRDILADMPEVDFSY